MATDSHFGYWRTKPVTAGAQELPLTAQSLNDLLAFSLNAFPIIDNSNLFFVRLE